MAEKQLDALFSFPENNSLSWQQQFINNPELVFYAPTHPKYLPQVCPFCRGCSEPLNPATSAALSTDSRSIFLCRACCSQKYHFFGEFRAILQLFLTFYPYLTSPWVAAMLLFQWVCLNNHTFLMGDKKGCSANIPQVFCPEVRTVLSDLGRETTPSWAEN